MHTVAASGLPGARQLDIAHDDHGLTGRQLNPRNRVCGIHANPVKNRAIELRNTGDEKGMRGGGGHGHSLCQKEVVDQPYQAYMAGDGEQHAGLGLQGGLECFGIDGGDVIDPVDACALQFP